MATDDRYIGMRLDATALRVLAHPLRSRLLSELRLFGPATATGLAERLSTNTGATSYHLRKLESVGLVTDTEEGEGKRRLWRASTSYHNFDPSDYRDDDDAAAALGWLQRDYLRRMAERGARWLDVGEQWPAEWVDAAGLSDTFVTVTPAQLRTLHAELDAVLERWRFAGEQDPAARRVQLSVLSHPSDLDAAPPAPVDGAPPAPVDGGPTGPVAGR